MRQATKAMGLRATAIAPLAGADGVADAEAAVGSGELEDSAVEDASRVVVLFLGFLVEMVLLE